MKFHSTINKAKKNQPSSWAKTALGIAENNGRSWKKDKENISDWWNCSRLANFVKLVDELDKHYQKQFFAKW